MVIARTVQSLLDQNYDGDLRVIVVDDQRLEMSVRLGRAHAFIYPLSASPCSSSSTSSSVSACNSTRMGRRP